MRIAWWLLSFKLVWRGKGTKIFYTFTAMRIYLIGYMASGKSKFGRLLAKKLNYGFLDIDYLFEERFHISVFDFFEKYNENAFRKIERNLLNETIDMEDVVISTGGGTPCFFDNMKVIKQSGISIYLHWDVASLLMRLTLMKRKRPLLKDVPQNELKGKVTAQLAEREFYYRQADLIIKGQDIDLEALIKLIRDHTNSN